MKNQWQQPRDSIITSTPNTEEGKVSELNLLKHYLEFGPASFGIDSD